MRRVSSLLITLSVVVAIIAGLLVYPGTLASLIPNSRINELTLRNDATLSTHATSTIYFTGDVMLARHVESFMNREGSSYPYRHLGWLNDEPAYVVGNFESAVPKGHIKTPNFGFRFSTSERHLEALRDAGFTHLSLANNHSLDFGEGDFQNTRSTLASSSLISFGHPTVVSSSSVTYFEMPGGRVAVLALHTLFTEPSMSELQNVIAEATKMSDLQIAYVHWGVEYEHTPSTAQQNLASELSNLGIDLIIGHHPHVTETIELVNGVPVFYSLGNFIFDQYFSAAVQDGLVLKLVKTETGYNISLLPVTSRDSHAQPRLMTDSEREKYLTELSGWSQAELAEAITKGELTLSHTLATLTETAIIGE